MSTQRGAVEHGPGNQPQSEAQPKPSRCFIGFVYLATVLSDSGPRELMVTMTGRPQRARNISVGVRRRGLRASGLLPALLDLLHRTLAFPLTPFRGSPGNARVLAQEGIRRASRAPGVHAAAQAARGDVLPIFEWVMEDPEALASSASSEFGRGGAWPWSRLLPALPARGGSPQNYDTAYMPTTCTVAGTARHFGAILWRWCSSCWTSPPMLTWQS